MKPKNLSNRIALNFMAATAVLIIVIFAAIYLVVYQTVYVRLNKDLTAECIEVTEGLVMLSSRIVFANDSEWEENEHGQVEVNPIFIQVADTTGKILRKSLNLMGASLTVYKNENRKIYFNTRLSGVSIRQFQMVLKNGLNQKAGYISVAIPLEESQMVLKNLLIILLTTFPVALFILFFVTKLIARESILPVQTLTESAEKITRENLNTRIPLPAIKNELYTLTATINSLLDRIEDTLLREKQFSADASHELRTPLSVLKGTLEMMIRKPRSSAYYIEKAAACLAEVDRMSVLVDQLLLLARYENGEEITSLSKVSLETISHNMIARHADILEQKKLSLVLRINEDTAVMTDAFMTEQILENIFSNATKYSYPNGNIEIFSEQTNEQVSLTIRDEGIGMNREELAEIFNRFYRADRSRNAKIRGYGLGLAIAKRFADLLQIKIRVTSQPGKGSAFKFIFPVRTNAEPVFKQNCEL